MFQKRLLLAVLAFALSLPLYAIDTNELISDAWPHDDGTRLSQLGHGVGVVFSPDLSVVGNCRFYQSLGFACFQDADWTRVLDDIRTYNIFHPENRIRTLVLETHGTNGNGLKLQKSYDPKADRSYIAVGALQEHLEPDGVRYIIISACNSRRLLRPAIYRTLDPNPGDKLFLPPTCGIVNADEDYDMTRSKIVVATPSASHIETTLVGNIRELAPVTRRVVAYAAKLNGVKPPTQFAISDIMMEMLIHDARLQLQTGEAIEELSKEIQPQDEDEKLYKSFVAYVNSIGAKDASLLPHPAAKPVVKKASAKRKATSKSASVRVR
ncbi:MAG TPA: hypothetical protein VH087_09315 [Thermoanaerobaculia bacterium]|jgi:hypothetical protein|nr:hypothetical protein [Thermoanaerobaculia bacterium]